MEDSQRRDELALERTHLANERTLLAYLRSALAFAAAGAAVLHFYSDSPLLSALAWLLIGSGLAVLSWGGRRFAEVKRRISR